MCFTTIIEIHKHFQSTITSRNHFFMVKSICVQPPLLARLATVLVWQRAVNRQPGYCSGNSKSRSPPAIIFQKIWNFKKNLLIFNFCESPGWIELWNSKVIFIFQYHFCKLQCVLLNNPWIHKHLHRSRHLQKLLFHGKEYLRAAAPPGPLSDCFGMATSGEPSTWLPPGELEGQEPLPLSFSRKFGFFKKSRHFSTFWKSLDPIELWNFKVIHTFQYHFYKLQHVLQNYYWIHNPTFSKECSSKTTFS